MNNDNLTLDLRVAGIVNIIVTQGINYPAISFEFESTPPAGFSITLEAYNGGVDQVFSIGNGITLAGNFYLWNLGTVTTPKGNYKGTITTSSAVFGVAIRANIVLNVV